jgi:hypothetical protein
MTVLITLTTAGADTGPFNLYSNVDGYVSAFETGVSKSALVAGYSSALVPNGTTTIRIKSTGTCVNYIDVTVVTTTTTTSSTTSTSSTTTTTTSTPPPPTTTSTTTGVGSFIVRNTTGSGQIDDVTTTGGAYFYVFNTGFFPLTSGQEGVGGGASLTGSPIFVTISNFSSTSCLSLYINGVLDEAISVTANGMYTFSNKTFTTGNTVLIEYKSGFC